MKALVLATDFDTSRKECNLEHVLSNTLCGIADAGCDEVIITTSQPLKAIQEIVSKLSLNHLICTYSVEKDNVDKGGSLLQERDLLDEDPFLLVDCETVSDFDFSELIRKGVPHNKLARLVFEPKTAHHTHEYFSLSKDGGISFTFDESFRGDDVIFSGAGVIDPYLIDRYAPDFPKFPLISLLFPTIHQGLACGELHDRSLA